jgi:hypothetical protein
MNAMGKVLFSRIDARRSNAGTVRFPYTANSAPRAPTGPQKPEAPDQPPAILARADDALAIRKRLRRMALDLRGTPERDVDRARDVLRDLYENDAVYAEVENAPRPRPGSGGRRV